MLLFADFKHPARHHRKVPQKRLWHRIDSTIIDSLYVVTTTVAEHLSEVEPHRENLHAPGLAVPKTRL